MNDFKKKHLLLDTVISIAGENRQATDTKLSDLPPVDTAPKIPVRAEYGYNDTVDNSVLEHVNFFLQTVTSDVRIEALNISTQADAESSLEKLKALQAQILQHKKTAHALKQLLRAELPEHPINIFN